MTFDTVCNEIIAVCALLGLLPCSVVCSNFRAGPLCNLEIAYIVFNVALYVKPYDADTSVLKANSPYQRHRHTCSLYSGIPPFNPSKNKPKNVDLSGRLLSSFVIFPGCLYRSRYVCPERKKSSCHTGRL